MKNFFSKLIYDGAIVFDLTKWLICALVLVIIVNTFFIAIFVVNGVSMNPTLKDKEFVLWNKNSYFKQDPNREDIVVINYPGDPNHKKYVKRVVGLPGDRVDVYKGKVYINKKLYSEQYLVTGLSSEPNGSWTLKSNQYFVMGDNRPNSNDSRYFGPVEKRFVLGKAISIIYPRIRLASNL